MSESEPCVLHPIACCCSLQKTKQQLEELRRNLQVKVTTVSCIMYRDARRVLCLSSGINIVVIRGYIERSMFAVSQ